MSRANYFSLSLENIKRGSVRGREKGQEWGPKVRGEKHKWTTEGAERERKGKNRRGKIGKLGRFEISKVHSQAIGNSNGDNV